MPVMVAAAHTLRDFGTLMGLLATSDHTARAMSATATDVEIDRIAEGELEAFMRSAGRAFLHRYSATQIRREQERFDEGRTLVARSSDGMVVGGASVHTMRLTVAGEPGATRLPAVPAAGLSWVHVNPTHRRQGIARRLMEAHLADCRAAGEPLGVLWASEGAIYRRFGYGPAVVSEHVEIDTARSAFRLNDIPQRIRMLTFDEAVEAARPVYVEYCRRMPGAIERDDTLWEAWIAGDPETYDDLPSLRSSRTFFAVCSDDTGRDAGYVRYRAVHEWNHGRPEFTIDVNELVAIDDDAYRQLWRFVLDIDLAATVSAAIRPKEPLRWLLRDPRAARVVGAEDGLWVRLINVPEALRARRYAADGELVIRVRDASAPGNDGTWKLTVRDGRGKVESTAEAPMLELDVSDLGSTYLGAIDFRSLETAGLVRDFDDRAVPTADAIFRRDMEPWCGVYF